MPETPKTPATTGRAWHTFGDDALADHDAVGLAELIRTGQVSREEVVAAAIGRAERSQPHLNAVEHPAYDQALDSTRPRPDGAFCGVPTFIKDNTDLAGLPTGHGSQAVVGRPATRDGDFARQFLGQGVVPLGKSRLPEFGFNATTEYADLPPTRNPWDTDYSSGASSGGAAALVASGVVPLAHANDGGGSIRIPAACCGLVGLKPTRGRLVLDRSNRSMPVRIVVDGVVTRSVRDTAAFFADAERVRRDTALPAIGAVTGPGTRRLRVGLVHDSITGHRTDDETRDAVTDAALLLGSLGHHVEEIPMPVGKAFESDFSLYWGMLSFMVSRFGHKFIGPDFDVTKLDNLSVGLAALYRTNVRSTARVVYRLRRSARDYARVFADYDIVLSPVLGHTTPRLGHLSPAQSFEQLFDRLLRYVSFTPLNNASGGPALSLPMGVTGTGLPIGVHFSAAHGGERTLLELAYEIEEARPWRRIQDVPDGT